MTLTGTAAQIATAKMLIAERVSSDVLSGRGAPPPSRAPPTRRRRHTVQHHPRSYGGNVPTEVTRHHSYHHRDSAGAMSTMTSASIRDEGFVLRASMRSLSVSSGAQRREETTTTSSSATLDNMGGVLLACGPDGSKGFSRRRSTDAGIVAPTRKRPEHVPLKPIVSNESTNSLAYHSSQDMFENEVLPLSVLSTGLSVGMEQEAGGGKADEGESGGGGDGGEEAPKSPFPYPLN